MAYSPVTAGEGFQLTGPLELDTGGPLPNLVNVSGAQLVFAPADATQPSGNLRFAATGNVSVDASASTYIYSPSSLDLTNLAAGIWKVQGVVTYTGGSKRYSSPFVIGVNAAL